VATKGPNQYKRPEDVSAAYQAQLNAQANARAIEKTAKEEAAKKSALNTQLNTLRQREAVLLAKKTAAEKSLAPNKTTLLNLQNAAISPGSPGGTTITTAEQNAINQYGSLYVAPYLKEIASLTTEYKTAVDATKATEKQLGAYTYYAAQTKVKSAVKNKATSKTTSKKTNTPGSSGDPIKSASFDPPIYYYNAPMVKTAYMNPFGPQQTYAGRTITNPGNYADAQESWKDTLGAKGVIQMDRNNVASYANSSTTSSKRYDDNLYGFKFLYNPKEVSMHWGVAEGQNWEGVAAGLDAQGNAFTQAMQYSTITFSLLLNRVGDMAYLDSNGLLAGVKDPYPDFPRVLGKSKSQEIAEIYKRGTMYDLEYLFKTVMGINSTYTSILNGETADKGWLQGVSVELHLGAGLRYLVRINSLDVNHIIFNDNMVPILSEVNISCSRFNDVRVD
jgi:hypothetical protein